jgi:hypothetical protein
VEQLADDFQDAPEQALVALVGEGMAAQAIHEGEHLKVSVSSTSSGEVELETTPPRRERGQASMPVDAFLADDEDGNDAQALVKILHRVLGAANKQLR